MMSVVIDRNFFVSHVFDAWGDDVVVTVSGGSERVHDGTYHRLYD